MKTCTRCGVSKPPAEFYRGKAKCGLRPECKACGHEKNRAWWQANPKRVREYHERHWNPERIPKSYGLTLDQHHSMLEGQDFRCAICSEERPLHIDHNHATQKVRALLCGPCNRAIGMLKDSPAFAENAANYLRAHA